MSRLDVTDLLFDPDVGGEPFQVIRRREAVNTYGEGANTEFNPVAGNGLASGAVYPSSRNALVREEAYSTNMKSMTVVTTFRLRGSSKTGGESFQPDLVVWGGDRYIVREVRDYSRYGAGFIEADCLQIEFTGAPPNIAPPVIGTMDFSNPAQSGLVGAL